jgi:hypothetical protein
VWSEGCTYPPTSSVCPSACEFAPSDWAVACIESDAGSEEYSSRLPNTADSVGHFVDAVGEHIPAVCVGDAPWRALSIVLTKVCACVHVCMCACASRFVHLEEPQRDCCGHLEVERHGVVFAAARCLCPCTYSRRCVWPKNIEQLHLSIYVYASLALVESPRSY